MVYHYPHPEWFRDWDRPDFKRINRPLILWGAGKIGGVAAHCLKQQGVEYAAFCDIASDKWGTQFCGHPVISPQELTERYPNAAVLITAVFYGSIHDMLRSRGFREIYDCASLFIEIDFSGYDFWMEEPYAIRNVEQCLAALLEEKTQSGWTDQIFLNITTRCSLRCQECSLFIPYVTEPMDFPAEEIMEDLNTVLTSMGYTRVINFYGGEPLLHPDLANMIRSLREDRRMDRISIITNGTIVPKEDVLQAMAEEERFMVRISDYGKISKNLTRLTDSLQQYKIPYEVANYTYWDRHSGIGITNDSEEKLAAKFRLCTACNVLFLINRRGYMCSTASAVCNMGGFPEHPSNYIDLANKTDFSERLSRFLKRRHTGEYKDACRYCSGNHCVQFEEKVPVAVQTKELLTFPKLI